MSGPFSDSKQPKKTTTSRPVTFDTTELLQELDKMREQLKHRADFQQKSSVLFEKPPGIDEKKQYSGNRSQFASSENKSENKSTGYTSLHQFRIDPPHPEIGVTATPAPSPSLDDLIPKNYHEGDGFRKEIAHKAPPSLHAGPPNPAPNKDFPTKQELPTSFLSDGYSELHSRRDYPHVTTTFPVEDPETVIENSPSTIPISRRKSPTTVPTSKNHTFRIDQKHETFGESPSTFPKIVTSRPYDFRAKNSSLKTGFMDILQFSFLAFGTGALVCSLLLYSRVWLFQLETQPTYGPYIVIAGVFLFLIGVLLRFVVTGNKKTPSHKQCSKPSKTDSRPPKSENENLSETYQRLLSLRTQVNEMINRVEEQVLRRKK